MIKPLAQRLEIHKLRCRNPATGWMFTTSKGTCQCINNLLNRLILPALNRCEVCGKSDSKHNPKNRHEYKRDARYPEWHGWHAGRRGLGSNLNGLGIDDSVIQKILRHSNISTTQAYYIKSSSADVKSAMATLEAAVSSLTIK